MTKLADGYVLVSAIVMILFLTTLGLAVSSLTAAQYQHTKREVFVQNAQLVAEAGIERSVQQLNTNNNFTGYSATQYFNNTNQGRSVYTTSVVNGSDGNSKTITSTGSVYRTASASSPYITRKVRVTVVGTSSSGYSVYSGPGGLVMSGSATILNSNVYLGGTLTLTGAAKIGSTNNPVDVDVANNACPTGNTPGSTYPQVCNNGTQPISLAQSTYIYGTVCATGQTSKGPTGSNIQGGNGGAGLKAGCTVPAVSPEVYNKSAQVSAVAVTGAGTSNTYVCNSWPFDRTWPANLKLTGNVTIDGSCNLKVNGNVYITGNLTVGGSARITTADGVGANRPKILVDGTINVGGSAAMIANNVGAGLDFISFKSSASCNPNCTSVSGTELKTTQSLSTITIGGSVNLPGMVFNAQWGKVSLAGSGNVGAVTGQTVDLSGAGTVVFGTTLSSGSKTWSITSYQPLY